MELTTQFQRVLSGYRLPTVGVEILHAEGMARKTSMYTILLPGACFLMAQSQLALRAHPPAHDAPCTCCPTRCIPSAARRCSTSCCSACTACDAACPYPRADDPSWGSPRALHRQMHSGFEATAVTDMNTIKDLLGEISSWLAAEGAPALEGQKVHRLELALVTDDGRLIVWPEDCTLGDMTLTLTLPQMSNYSCTIATGQRNQSSIYSVVVMQYPGLQDRPGGRDCGGGLSGTLAIGPWAALRQSEVSHHDRGRAREARTAGTLLCYMYPKSGVGSMSGAHDAAQRALNPRGGALRKLLRSARPGGGRARARRSWICFSHEGTTTRGGAGCGCGFPGEGAPHVVMHVVPGAPPAHMRAQPHRHCRLTL
jgi:hypothetical protein